MITRVLYRIFAVVRFVQIEWLAWSQVQDEHMSSLSSPEVERTVLLDPIEVRRRAYEAEIRERLPRTGLRDDQIRNAAIGFVNAEIDREKREAKDAQRRAGR